MRTLHNNTYTTCHNILYNRRYNSSCNYSNSLQHSPNYTRMTTHRPHCYMSADTRNCSNCDTRWNKPSCRSGCNCYRRSSRSNYIHPSIHCHNCRYNCYYKYSYNYWNNLLYNSYQNSHLHNPNHNFHYMWSYMWSYMWMHNP